MKLTEFSNMRCPHCGGATETDPVLAEKKDACYHKVRGRYKVWPSAYASGALVQCRKKGAANWGNKSEGVAEGSSQKQQKELAYNQGIEDYDDPEVTIPNYKSWGQYAKYYIKGWKSAQELEAGSHRNELERNPERFDDKPGDEQGVAEGSVHPGDLYVTLTDYFLGGKGYRNAMALRKKAESGMNVNDLANMLNKFSMKKWGSKLDQSDAIDAVKNIVYPHKFKQGVAEISDKTQASYKEKAQAQVRELEPHAKQGEYRDIAQRMIDRRKRGLERVKEAGDYYGYKEYPEEKILALIRSGNWEANNDVVAGKMVELRNTRTGKTVMVRVASAIKEGNMPASVIKAKQHYAQMTPGDFARATQSRSDDELMAMARRHGYGQGSTHYVDKRKKGQGTVSEVSDPSGLWHAARNLNRVFRITAKTAEGDVRRYRVRAQSERVAREKFSQHYNQATVQKVEDITDQS